VHRSSGIKASCSFHFADDQSGNEVARQGKENIDSREATAESGNPAVKQDYKENGNPSQAFNIRPETGLGVLWHTSAARQSCQPRLRGLCRYQRGR
jgi:hypothetical protein